MTPEPGGTAPAPWLLLSRPDCHLCEAFEAALRVHLGPALPALDYACVDERGEWRMRYGHRIPVLLDADGRVLAEGVFEAAAFERALRS
ncbi:glutaredoxin family protein [Solimonas flava]|uniref:glutaredoxin family protein n=1 Tax=Solimonas flava TaxID=415849 RepID=UPI0004074FAB|nr:glutaredoxin family protein [Solimonas flava]